MAQKSGRTFAEEMRKLVLTGLEAVKTYRKP